MWAWMPISRRRPSGRGSAEPGAAHGRAAAAADPLQHRQPAGERAARAGVPVEAAHRRRVRVRVARTRRGPAEPDCAPAWPGAGTNPVPGRPRRHRACGALGVERRSVGGRAARGDDLGPGCARHEGPGGERGRRGGAPRRLRLAAGKGRADDRDHRRRGSGRGDRRALALRAGAGEGALRHDRQRRRRRGARVRRPQVPHVVRGGEGRLPVQPGHGGRGRPRIDAVPWARTRC